MSIKDTINQILSYAINAPSGGNSQPWTFKIEETKLTIFFHPEKDNPILNFNYRGTLIAHGALIENILISATHYKLEADLSIVQNSKEGIIAEIIFKESQLLEDPLYSSIPTRSTNRKKYKDENIPDQIISDIFNNANGVGAGMALAHFITDKKKMAIAGEAISNNEVIMLENKELHELFFKEVIWNSDQEKARGGSGLYIKTLELNKPQEMIFRVIRFWPMMLILKKFGLAKFIASENAKIYMTGGAMGIISVSGTSNENFITAGRILEKIWLSCAKKNISLQLMTGILFMWQKLEADKTDYFSPSESGLIRDSYARIIESFSVKDDIITLMFRMGYAENPSSSSYKKEPVIIND